MNQDSNEKKNNTYNYIYFLLKKIYFFQMNQNYNEKKTIHITIYFIITKLYFSNESK